MKTVIPSESIRVHLSPLESNWVHPSSAESSRVFKEFSRVHPSPSESIRVICYILLGTEEFNRVKNDENSDSSRVHLSPFESNWVQLSLTKSIRVHLSPSESIRVHLSPSESRRVLQSLADCIWVICYILLLYYYTIWVHPSPSEFLLSSAEFHVMSPYWKKSLIKSIFVKPMYFTRAESIRVHKSRPSPDEFCPKCHALWPLFCGFFCIHPWN